VSRGGAAVVVHGSSEATSSPEVEEQDSRRGSWDREGRRRNRRHCGRVGRAWRRAAYWYLDLLRAAAGGAGRLGRKTYTPPAAARSARAAHSRCAAAGIWAWPILSPEFFPFFLSFCIGFYGWFSIAVLCFFVFSVSGPLFLMFS
jgi:hypothetical protein